ncbi:ABC transporter permease [Rhizobium sp. C4]|uniref:ABC transporter permease n=1 Tax=Rhizobium sp. C4 TaxID=1349800 RepID=UPI001E2C711E|nr:ABC transporter permease [Rhizobium sp. C4]MCD2172572.1 ABC transporter permease [Rhizobium sp. C4]
MSSTRSNMWKAARRETARALTALVMALLVAFIIVLITSKSPVETFGTLLSGPMTSKRTIGLWIDDVAKLTMTGLAFSLVFQARQFSMGVQGQVYMGGLFSALVALSPIGPTAIGMPAAVLAGMAAGACYGFIPGYAKARLGANEIVSSLMLNYIAVNLVTYLVREPLVAAPGLLSTANFPPNTIFPTLIDRTRIDLGLILALISVAVTWFALYRTSWGLKLRLVGHNARFAEYAGIKANFIMVSAMTASGALGGLLGAMFVQGQAYGKLLVQFEGNLAFEGILIAIVARNRPLAVPVVALFYGYLRQGALIMGIRTDVPTEVIAVVQAIIILLVASSFKFGGGRLLARLKPAKPATATGAGA